MQRIHEYGGFKVDKNEIAKLLFVIHSNSNLKNQQLQNETGFGKNKIENLKYYLKHFSLLDKNYNPTDLSRIIFFYDKYFEDELTLWILFFHWTKKDSNPFLYFLINESIINRTKEELTNDFRAWSYKSGIKTDYDRKDFVDGLVARTLNSFLDIDAFKNLNIYKCKSEKYSRENPYKINPLVVAYVLYSTREGRTTISFEELLSEHNNIGKIFNLDRETLQQQIYGLRDLSLVQYVQAANLHDLVYTYQGTTLQLLEKYYEQC